MQANPFDQFDAPAAPVTPGVIYGAPKQPEPLELARFGLAQEEAGRSVARDARDDQRLSLAVAQDQRDQQKVVRETTKDAFEQANKLRGDYEALPAVKSYTTALPVYAAGLESKPDSAGDLNLIYAYAKVMDPTSVVREGEQASVAGGDTWINAKTAELKKQLTGEGGTFQPEYRKRLREEMANRMGQLNKAFIGERVRYKQTADRYGVNPYDVVGEHPGSRFQELSERVLGRKQVQLDYNGEPISPRAGEGAGGDDDGSAIIEGLKAGKYDIARDGTVTENGKPIPAPDAAINNAEVRGLYRAKYGEALPLQVSVTGETQPDPSIAKDAARLASVSGGGDVQTLMSQGLTFGLSDELAGITTAATRGLTGDTNFSRNYQVGRDAENLRAEGARERMGALGMAAEIGGGVIGGGGVLGGALRGTAGLGARVAQGLRVGAGTGALAGFGYGRGTEGSAGGAVMGGVLGGALGSAIPVAGQVARNRVGGLNRLLGRDPELPQRLVARAIEADGNTPRGVATRMVEAQRRGSPMSIADTGENARALLGAVSRQPGASRTLARESTVLRQAASEERISDAVRRDLGQTANIRELGDQLIASAQEKAAPLYEKAYAAPGASAVKLDDLLERPSMRAGMSRAYRIAQEEGRDPKTLGFDLDAEGNTVLTRVPSWHTLDYVKRGIDDVLESRRDPITNKLRLDEEGRAINNTLRSFLARVDRVNPAYAEARKAYAGPAKMREALDKGARALTKSPDDLSAQMKTFGPAELEMYQVGLRKAITDMLESKGDFADKVNALIGTPKKRRALQTAFGNKEGYENFIATLRDEGAMSLTYRAVNTGSPTAERLAADAQVNDTGLAETVVDAALRGSKDGVVPAVVNAIQSLREIGKFGVGEAGERAREDVAAHLTQADAAQLELLLKSAKRLRARERLSNRNANRRVLGQSVQVGELTGRVTAPSEGSGP